MSHRIQIVVDATTHQALLTSAAQRKTRASTLAATIVTQAMTVPPETTNPQASSSPTPPPDRTTPNPTPAAWLQRDRGHDWQTEMWHAAQQLRAWYPDLKDVFRDGWHTDRFTRDGIFALTIWRAQIDHHANNDPRLEHHWLTALHDFTRMHDDHRRHIGGHYQHQPIPDNWTPAPPGPPSCGRIT